MSKKVFKFILSVGTKGWQNFNKAQKGVSAFNREVKSGNKIMANATSQVAGLVGAYLGFDALRNTARIIKEANTAAFNLESSLMAANREFDNVGSIKSWSDIVDELSIKLRIYSKADLKTAAARTVDMTKRLGLSADEMERVLEATADLAAGKFNLEDGIERVTAALRGEGEASEALGLTLNETYVKAWYEASDAYEKAWKNLSDVEKAHVRYQVFLEQALPLQGKAARSVKTLAGAWGLITGNINDAITENKDMVEVTKDLAKYLADNADELGDLAARMAEGAANTAKFVIEHKELIIWAGKAGVALLVVGKIVG